MKSGKSLPGIYKRLFTISAFTFGGGYAMLPMVEKELVEKDGWLTDQQMLDDYAMAQSIPGVIGVNCSALMGYRLAGRTGSFTAVLGFISPSVILLTLIAAFLGEVQDLELVQKAFMGLRAGVVALMLNSLIKIMGRSLKTAFCYLLFFLALSAVLLFSFHPVWIILGGGLSGLLLSARFIKEDAE